MEMLEKLRSANFDRQQKKSLVSEIQKQFEQINKLNQEKDALMYRLQALNNGHVATDFLPSFAQEPEFLAAHNKVASLKQKLSAYRLLGPCGLTVLQVSTKSLVVSFTSVWKNLTQVFMLRIADDKDAIKLAGTTIPYFIDVQSMLTSTEVSEWPKTMDDIGFLLNAFTQRKREVEYVKSEYKSAVRQISWNDSVTNVDIHVSVENEAIGGRRTNLQLDLTLIYDNIQALSPGKVRLASSHFLSKEEVGNIRNLMKSKALSEAFQLLLEKLVRVPLDSEDDEDAESDAEAANNDHTGGEKGWKRKLK